MSIDNRRRLTGVFDAHETRALRGAYQLALHALAMTHAVDEMLKARLADIILSIYARESVPDIVYAVDTGALAARSVERYLTFHQLRHPGPDVTLH